jgi:hypothetical protein
MPSESKRSGGWAAGLMAGLGLVTTLFAPAALSHNSQSIVRGAGTTIIEGGTGSATFTLNAMYVTGRITGAVVNGDVATLTGTATITGLGAGTNVPFEIVVHEGGPGTTAVLTAAGLVFHEILVEGSIEVFERKE